jgi:UrcA family protein
MKSILAFVGAAALAATSAAAETVVVTAAPTAKVSYADLDLNSAAGQARLQQRIRGAAGDLCLEDNVGSLKERLQRNACFAAAVTDGDRQVDELLAGRTASAAAAAGALVIRTR